MDAKSLYIIKRESGVCLYHRDFKEPMFDPHLISSFIAAMTSFFTESNYSVMSTARAFEGADYKIVLEFGEWTVGALVVNKDTEALREKLRAIIQEFEKQFSILRYIDLDLAVYTRFEKTVMSEFIFNEITPETIIRKKLNWDLITDNPDVRSFLQLLPEKCSVRDAAEFLEMPVEVAMKLTAEALWERAITVSEPVRPDDIFSATVRGLIGGQTDDVSPDTARAIRELDGETPLAIAAERVKTSDLQRFLEEVAMLARRRAIERVSPSQTAMILWTSLIQQLLNIGAKILGTERTARVFTEARRELLGVYPWLAFVDLEREVDVDIRSGLIASAVKGEISPVIVNDGFRALTQFFTKRLSRYVNMKRVNEAILTVKDTMEKEFPTRCYDIEWELLKVSEESVI